MPFAKGQSGNPAGWPVGSRNRFTREMDEALEQRGLPLVNAIVTHAHAANPSAMRLCLDRLLPMGKHRPFSVELPPVDTPDYTMVALAEVQRALAEGEITTEEGMRLLGFVERATRILASKALAQVDVADRLDRIEQALLLLTDGKPTPAQEATASDAVSAPQPPAEAAIVNNNAETMNGAVAGKAVQAALADVRPRGSGNVKEHLMNSVSPLAPMAATLPQPTTPVAVARTPLANAA